MQKTIPLNERLKQQIEQGSTTIQNLTQKQLNIMQNELSNMLNNELHTIKNDIRHYAKRSRWIFLKNRMIWALTIGLSLSMGIYAGSLAMTHYYSQKIQQLHAEIIEKQDIVEQLNRLGGQAAIRSCNGKP